MAEFAQASLRAQERKWTAALWIYMVSIVALAVAIYFSSRKHTALSTN
jgi:hypothetical protein